MARPSARRKGMEEEAQRRSLDRRLGRPEEPTVTPPLPAASRPARGAKPARDQDAEEAEVRRRSLDQRIAPEDPAEDPTLTVLPKVPARRRRP